MEKVAVLLAVIGLAAACSGGTPATLALNSASVDPSYTCPAGSVDAPYSVHGVIGLHNGTPGTVTIKSVTALMTLAAVKGAWLEKVGDKYEAAGVTSTPSSVGPGNNASMQVTIPSMCTRGKTTGSDTSYGEYSVGFTVTTSTGTYKIQSSNLHRIVAA